MFLLIALCGADICPSVVVVLDDVAVLELVDALVLGEIENGSSIGDDSIPARVLVESGIENKVFSTGVLNPLVKRVGNEFDIIAIDFAATHIAPAGAVC